MIYHIVEESTYRRFIGCEEYLPVNFKDYGFVHCALENSVISVANDYYLSVEENLLLLMIDPLKLHSETRYEAAVPGQEAGTQHLSTSPVFPHIYGPVDLAAVKGIGVLGKDQSGYIWPKEFLSPGEYFQQVEQRPTRATNTSEHS